METPERLENLPATPEPSSDSIDVGNSIEELRLNQLKEQKGVCVICYCNLRNGKRCFPENCLHIFHFECLRRWSEQKNQCPLCKKGEYIKVNFYDFQQKNNMDVSIFFLCLKFSTQLCIM